MPLRLFDWRLLLRGPGEAPFEHLLIAGGTEDLAQAAEAAGIARRATRWPLHEGLADGIAIFRDFLGDPAAVAGRLAAGGALYCEPRSSLSWVARSGLQDVRLYWAAPGRGQPRAYVPLTTAGLSWLLRNGAEPLELRATLRAIAAKLLAGRGIALPEVALTARAGEDRSGAELSLWRGHLERQVGVGLLTPGGLDRSGVAQIVFEGGDSRPGHVLKARRSPQFNGLVEDEHRVLEALQAELPRSLARSVPKPLRLEREGDYLLSLQTYAPGPSLAASTAAWYASRRQQLRGLRLVSRWLAGVHRGTQQGIATWDAHARAEWIDRPLSLCRQLSGQAEQELFARTQGAAEALDGLACPLVRQHNDLDPWNIHLSGSQISVLDWERSRPGPALTDLLHFVSIWYSLALKVPRSAQLAAIADLFIPTGSGERQLVSAVQQEITSYLGVMSMDARFVPVLLVATLADQAVQRALSAAPGDARSINRQAGYLKALAPQAEELFRCS